MDTVSERIAFWRAVVEAGVGSFLVRRTLQRVERGELGIRDALRLLRHALPSPSPSCRRLV
jgi:hypothetical protein